MSETLERCSEILAYRKETLRQIAVDIRQAETLISALQSDIDVHRQAVALADMCIRERVKVVESVEELSTELLQAVFGPDYCLKFEVVEKDGIPVGYKPSIGYKGCFDSPSEYGGGVRNIAGFAVRLVFLLLDPSLAQVQLLDEPNVNLDASKWQRFVAFLENLTKSVPVQVVMVTHSKAELPVTYRVTKEAGVSKVDRV